MFIVVEPNRLLFAPSGAKLDHASERFESNRAPTERPGLQLTLTL